VNDTVLDFVCWPDTVIIHGECKDTAGVPLPGMKVVINGGRDSAFTDANGVFLDTCRYDSTRKFVPHDDNWFFTPESLTLTHLVRDTTVSFTGRHLAIQGTITGEVPGQFITYGPIADATVEFEGLGQTTTNAAGEYWYPVTSGWSGKVTLSKLGYTMPETTFTNVRTMQTYSPPNWSVTLPTHVEGYVKTIAGQAIKAHVIFRGLDSTITATSNGIFRYVLPYDWSGWVVVHKDGALVETWPDSVWIAGIKADTTFSYEADNIFTVSGYVRTAGGQGIEGVALGGTLTNSTGYYSYTLSIQRCPDPMPYRCICDTLKPVKGEYKFTPDSALIWFRITDTTVNFVGQPPVAALAENKPVSRPAAAVVKYYDLRGRSAQRPETGVYVRQTRVANRRPTTAKAVAVPK